MLYASVAMSSGPVKRDIKQQRAARTREEILEAAITEFSQRSFLGTSMVQLAKAIRMTPGALYWHFPTKEDLLLAAIEELHSRFMKEFEFLLTEGRKLTATQQLLGFFDRTQNFFRYHREYGKFYSMVTVLSAESNERVATALRDVLNIYALAVQNIIRYGQNKTREFRQDMDAETVAHTIIGCFSGIILQQTLFRQQLSFDPMAVVFEKLAVDGLSAKPSEAPAEPAADKPPEPPGGG